ncbi:XRE family transcriptional regulator [Sphaerisporangium sp. NPDC088356]|uniref:helix-turn-helix domain-containing protein n=1 Tax=Sphaerisporangium sp. NPDC088356 TaxID=3154871 RepID=UPI003424C4B1
MSDRKSRRSDGGQIRLFDPSGGAGRGGPSPQAVADAFDQARLTQARRLAGMTKKDLSERVGVTPAAVGQYETGMTHPRPDLIPRLADALGVPLAFFLSGRPHAKLDGSMAHFRSLRSTRVHQRAKAVAFVEQVWELTHALEKRVRLPHVDLPGFSGGEVHSGVELPRDPAAAARELRRHWGLGTGPISHLVRHMEAHGIVVVLPPPDEDATTVDAFSTSQLPRPIVVLTANRFDDIHRYRFTAAHELGHLVLHGDTAAGDVQQEREADTFAAEFLTPRDSILLELPRRLDLRRLAELKHVWGVSISSLLYRCREVGLLSDSSASRAYQRLGALRDQPGFASEPITGYPGEHPVLLRQAFDLAAADTDLTMATLATQLAWPLARVRELLGIRDQRPKLVIVP